MTGGWTGLLSVADRWFASVHFAQFFFRPLVTCWLMSACDISAVSAEILFTRFVCNAGSNSRRDYAGARMRNVMDELTPHIPSQHDRFR